MRASNSIDWYLLRKFAIIKYSIRECFAPEKDKKSSQKLVDHVAHREFNFT